MRYKVSKRTKTGGQRFNDLIFFEVDNPKTYAASVLLKDYYEQRDVDYINTFAYRMRRIAFSRNFLKRELKKKKVLCCAYCHQPNLKIEFDGMKIPNNIKATIDHIEPISTGGGVFDVKNIAVACGKCNTLKSNMPVTDFLMKFAVYLGKKREFFANKLSKQKSKELVLER